MFQKFKQLKKLWQLSKIDFSIWVVAFVATVGTDVIQGLAIAIVYALFTIVIREQWPKWHILGNIVGTNDFRDMERYRHIYFFNRVCVLRFDSPLLFTNVERFRKVVEKVATEWDDTNYCGRIDKKHLIPEGQNNKNLSTSTMSQEQKRFLIIDCSGFTYVDIMGVNILKEVHEDLRKKNVVVSFAAAKAPVRELFEASGLYRTVAKTNFYPTIYDAIAYAQLKQSNHSMNGSSLDVNGYDCETLDTTDDSIQCLDCPHLVRKSSK
ncbi:STAS domain protein [Dictyocaulus viviparus]|uniref:STAS domain protein n=1 Tax=Dictyocaulus viviparus TaxID=29172 RepID=A0A0D8XUP4_DICVI|nr:STAS domain protein [Dictyocaulus viviparus]